MNDDRSVLLGVAGKSAPVRTLAPDTERAWTWVWWFALVLTAAGGFDWLLTWYPLRFGNTEWEFGTIVTTTSSLPLISMGFAGLLGAAAARGIRWQLIGVSLLLLLWALMLLGAMVIFLLDAPLALKAVQGPAHSGVLKAIVRTLFLGTLFLMLYFGMAVVGLRQARRRR